MSTKIRVLLLSILGTVVAVSLFNSRESGLCSLYCGPAIGKFQDIFLFFPLVLFFSIITMFTKEAVFTAWWKFARYAIPTVLLISFIISLKLHHGSGVFSLAKEGDLVVMSFIYLIFILGSSFQMYRGFVSAVSTEESAE